MAGKPRYSPQEAALKIVYGGIVQRARRKNLSLEINFEDFCIMATSQCHYCGSPPSNGQAIERKGQEGERHYYQGIDRIENSLGYTKENCIPCCIKCNKIKSDVLSYREMIAVADVLALLDANDCPGEMLIPRRVRRQ